MNLQVVSEFFSLQTWTMQQRTNNASDTADSKTYIPVRVICKANCTTTWSEQERRHTSFL